MTLPAPCCLTEVQVVRHFSRRAARPPHVSSGPSSSSAFLRVHSSASRRAPLIHMCRASTPVRRKPHATNTDARPGSSAGDKENTLTTPCSPRRSRSSRNPERKRARSTMSRGAVSHSTKGVIEAGLDLDGECERAHAASDLRRCDSTRIASERFERRESHSVSGGHLHRFAQVVFGQLLQSHRRCA